MPRSASECRVVSPAVPGAPRQLSVPRWPTALPDLVVVDTFDAKDDALARMHADALSRSIIELAYAVKDLVAAASIEALS